MRLEGGPWFVGLDELIRHYSHGANGLPCTLSEACPGDTLPPHLLASGPDTPLHAATRNHDIQGMIYFLKQIEYIYKMLEFKFSGHD